MKSRDLKPNNEKRNFKKEKVSNADFIANDIILWVFKPKTFVFDNIPT